MGLDAPANHAVRSARRPPSTPSIPLPKARGRGAGSESLERGPGPLRRGNSKCPKPSRKERTCGPIPPTWTALSSKWKDQPRTCGLSSRALAWLGRPTDRCRDRLSESGCAAPRWFHRSLWVSTCTSGGARPCRRTRCTRRPTTGGSRQTQRTPVSWRKPAAGALALLISVGLIFQLMRRRRHAPLQPAGSTD